MCVGVCMRAPTRVCVHVRMCLCVCVCVRERERERLGARGGGGGGGRENHPMLYTCFESLFRFDGIP